MAQTLLEPTTTIPLDRRLEVFRAFPRNLDHSPRVLLDGWSWSFRDFGDPSLSISQCLNPQILEMGQIFSGFRELGVHDVVTLKSLFAPIREFPK
jgi:hypothetical protein